MTHSLRLLRAAALAGGLALLGCAGPAGPLTYPYPPSMPGAYVPDAALGAVAFRNGDRIDLFLPNYDGDPRRRPERFTFEPRGGPGGIWLGHPYRLPEQADIVARPVPAGDAVPDGRTGRRVALVPPGTLEVTFPGAPRYGAMAGQTFYLVPAGLGTRRTPPFDAAVAAWQEPR